MSAHVVVTLDTAAPEVTFGEPEGTAGTTVTVPYSLDEPAALSARLVDVTGQVIPLSLHADEVTGSVVTAIPGLARLDIRTRDDLLNEAWRSLSFMLSEGPQLVGAAEITMDSMLATMGTEAMTTDLAVDTTRADLAVDPMTTELEVES